jgi:hypothetical protein
MPFGLDVRERAGGQIQQPIVNVLAIHNCLKTP